MISSGDLSGLLAWLSAALFIPSLALALGVWSSGKKLFEVLYISLWYQGPMNGVLMVDNTCAHSSGNIQFFLPISLGLVVAALIGRARQIRN